MNSSRLPVGPEELLAYYERIGASNPDPHWRHGAEVCKRWIQMKVQDASESEVRDFIRELRSVKHAGSAWSDLRAQFLRWAGERGFDV